MIREQLMDFISMSPIVALVIEGHNAVATVRKVTFQADFNSVEMSGTHLTEFGLFTTGTAALVGSSWLRESFGSIVFDGTNELQVLSTIDFLPG